MGAFKFFILLLVIPLLPAIAVGEETLPRVLILGDSIYQQPAGEAANQRDASNGRSAGGRYSIDCDVRTLPCCKYGCGPITRK